MIALFVAGFIIGNLFGAGLLLWLFTRRENTRGKWGEL